MMNNVQAFRQKEELSPAVMLKLLKSKPETEHLAMRDIRCPFCGFLVEKVFSDISGHKQIYCKKCKQEYVINLGYFRRQKRKPYFRVTFPYKGRQNR